MAHFVAGAFDEVWVLPVYRHMFDEKLRGMASFDDRVRMARLNFEGLDGTVAVSEVERELNEAAATRSPPGVTPERVGTVDVVKFLRSEHPDADFSLVLGGDTYEGLMGGKPLAASTQHYPQPAARRPPPQPDQLGMLRERSLVCAAAGNAAA